MFAIHSVNLPAIYSYDSAKRYYNSIEPLRGYPSDAPRPIGRRSSSNSKTVRMLPDGSIAFRYHALDCVIFHCDTDGRAADLITINTYPSASTKVFINALTPAGVTVGGSNHSCDEISLTHLQPDFDVRDVFTYKLRGTSVILSYSKQHLGYVITSVPAMTIPFRHYAVDRKLANAAYKAHNLKKFMDFFVSFVALHGYKSSSRWRKTLDWDQLNALPDNYRRSVRLDDLLACLRDEDRAMWTHIVNRLCVSVSVNPIDIKRYLMSAIKASEDCVTYTEIPCISASSVKYSAIMASEDTYEKLVTPNMYV